MPTSLPLPLPKPGLPLAWEANFAKLLWKQMSSSVDAGVGAVTTQKVRGIPTTFIYAFVCGCRVDS